MARLVSFHVKSVGLISVLRHLRRLTERTFSQPMCLDLEDTANENWTQNGSKTNMKQTNGPKTNLKTLKNSKIAANSHFSARSSSKNLSAPCIAAILQVLGRSKDAAPDQRELHSLDETRRLNKW